MEGKEDIFKYGIKGGHNVREIKFDFIGLIKKISKPLIIIIILALAVYAGYYFKKCPVCETCDVCESQACPELDCNVCPKQTEKVTVIKYPCSNGMIVDNIDQCNPLNYVKIDSPYLETNNGVRLSIDKIEYESAGDYDRVTEIDYTIINTNERDIKPIILVNLYSPDQEKKDQGLVHQTFDDNETIGSNEWTVKKHKTEITFKGNNTIVRLVLRDTLPDPNVELVRVERPVDQ